MTSGRTNFHFVPRWRYHNLIFFKNWFLSKKYFEKIFQIFIAIPWKWSTECFKTDCAHKLSIKSVFFKHLPGPRGAHSGSKLGSRLALRVPSLSCSFSPFVFSPLCLPVVSPHGGSTGLIPMQRVGVSIVFRQRARALVENESTKARGPAGPTWNPTWNLNGQPLDLVGENLFQQCGKFAEPPETNQPGTQLGTWTGTPWTW